MAKHHNPTSPGRRFLIIENNDDLTKKPSPYGKGKKIKPLKSLLTFKKKSGGRNNLGRITCYHRGGGAKRFYRIVDFKRDKVDIEAKVLSIEYDPNRSCRIALICYADGEKKYILAPRGLRVGAKVSSGVKAPFEIGCSMPLKNMPLGSVIHNVELRPGRGGVFVRSAGMSAQLVALSGGFATVKLPSKEVRLVREDCFATFGELSNAEHSLRIDGKAGRRRWEGVRPTVRGVAMNPVDHPHGGGEGRRQHTISFNPWTSRKKGEKTRKRSKSNEAIVKKRGKGR